MIHISNNMVSADHVHVKSSVISLQGRELGSVSA
jgi:hypothetical protein